MATGSLGSANALTRFASSTEFHWLGAALEAAATANGTRQLTQEPSLAWWTCLPRVATRTLTPDARAVREAREFARTITQRWGAASRCDDIALVVSELVTNALRHAAPGPDEPPQDRLYRLGLLQPGPFIQCVVTDPSPAPPIPREPACLAETGRGLHVIAALSDQWGYANLCEQGKAMWAIFTTDQPDAIGMDGTG
jgi:hypothetical protein